MRPMMDGHPMDIEGWTFDKLRAASADDLYDLMSQCNEESKWDAVGGICWPCVAYLEEYLRNPKHEFDPRVRKPAERLGLREPVTYEKVEGFQ